MNEEKNYEANIVEVAKLKFATLLSQSYETREQFLTKCISNIEKQIGVLPCISILKQIVDQLPTHTTTTHQTQITKSKCLKVLIEENNIVNILLNSIKQYKLLV